jgi:hypothetical protein
LRAINVGHTQDSIVPALLLPYDFFTSTPLD